MLNKLTVSAIALFLLTLAVPLGVEATAGPSLIGEWNFDSDAPTTATDDSGNDNHLDGVNLSSANWVASTLRCSTGNMLSLDSSEAQMLTSGEEEPEVLRPDSVSVTAWVNFSSIQEESILIAGDGVFGEGIHGYMLASYLPYYEIIMGTTNGFARMTLAEEPTVGDWFFLSGSYDASDSSHSLTVTDIDGNPVDGDIDFASWDTGAIDYTYADGFKIGGYYGDTLDGSIDEVVVHDYPLSEAEVTELGSCPAPEVEEPVEDTDGVDNEVEAAAPNNGDANNDGTPDNQQETVASTVSPVTDDYVTVETSTCGAVNAVTVEQETTVETEDDDDFDYPVGLVDFTLTGCASGGTETIVQYYFGDYALDNLVARKYDKSTDTYTTIDSATLSEVVVGGESAIKVVYSITDGGELDADGEANGTIVDPVGLGEEVLADTGSEAITSPLAGISLAAAAIALVYVSREKLAKVTKIAVRFE